MTEEHERAEKLGVRCISLYCDTNEHYQKDDTKVYFFFHDYANQMSYKGAITWDKLFELVKPHLKAESDTA